ncbi:hypothetical protein [Polaribacter porphyrae]|uniref:Uncharacterized protein n=1 Tax=Polaribacter porphyrae TaxID=1137780 RepID=A0A2S7WKN8_9FLAO|nr:hypothetical protein [Polaribacter porphyrae]PQJ78170.1 hypothetical protein BTO18_02730 [Polaribacter porphyrae]
MKLKKIAFSLFLLTCLFVQLCLSLYHSLGENHIEELCTYNDIEHFCNHDLEKHEHYFELTLNYDISFNYKFVKKQQINSVDILKNDFLANHNQLPFSLRGPPHFNFI